MWNHSSPLGGVLCHVDAPSSWGIIDKTVNAPYNAPNHYISCVSNGYFSDGE